MANNQDNLSPTNLSSTNLSSTNLSSTNLSSNNNQSEQQQHIHIRLPRFKHDSHPHRLFRNIIREVNVQCDNQHCKRILGEMETSYTCFRCDFDLCVRCFYLQTEQQSIEHLHDSDNDICDDEYLILCNDIPIATSVRTQSVTPQDVIAHEMIPHEMIVHSTNNSNETNNDNNNNNTMFNPIANITFESGEYDLQTTEQVNTLLASMTGHVAIVASSMSSLSSSQHNMNDVIETTINHNLMDNSDNTNNYNE